VALTLLQMKLPTGAYVIPSPQAVDPSRPFKLGVQGWDELHSITWSADGKTLFAGWHHQSDSALLRIALDGTVSVLIRSNNPQILGAVPSPDGRFLLIAEASTARNVWQIENF